MRKHRPAINGTIAVDTVDIKTTIDAGDPAEMGGWVRD